MTKTQNPTAMPAKTPAESGHLSNENSSCRRHHQQKERLHNTESAILDTFGDLLERSDPQKYAAENNRTSAGT
ncbi:hypothetical protein [Rhizobium sp. K102]|uniref:hypothetical protein n=1 Tax=Rhizobium sp. K102 TaxID=2918527 RepID=UPI001EFBCAF5|nr:hypothetical protein [Rhizobium sp. K102]ULR46910.1 hypothetical protein MHI61_29150 [Rhizobium sp. K102]